MTTSVKPKQKTSLRHKMANDMEDLKKTIDYYKNSTSDFYTRRSDFIKLYELANGVFDESYYNYVTQPIASNKDQHKKFPSKIRNYDIITPLLRLLAGEKTKRPFPYQVIVHNEDSHINKREEINSQVNNVVQQMFINQLNNMGMETGMETQEIPMPDKLKTELEYTWADKRAIWGQHALGYIIENQDVNDKWDDCFMDMLITDYCFTYKDVFRHDVDYQWINPFEISYVAGEGIKYIENGEAAVRRTMMSINEVIDRFGDLLKDHEIDELEDSTKPSFSEFIQPNQFLKNYGSQLRPSGNIEVVHSVFKSLRKIGKVTRMTPFGDIEEFEVDEFYVVSDYEIVDWVWVSQVFEGYKIADKYYCGIQMIPNLRGHFDNPSICKLPYNGRCFSNNNSQSLSLVERMMPYQILYNIVHYRLELTLAKNKDKLTIMPLGLVPDRKNMDMFDTMYYADSTGYLFFDETKKNAIQALQYVKTLDASLSQHIKFAADLCAEIKQNLEDFLGISRQRKGQISSSDGLGNSERAIFQSSIITEVIFSKFDKFQQKELQGFLDLSRHAWRDGKKGQYLNSESQRQMFEIPEEKYANSELGVFANISSKEQEKLQELKSHAQAFSQNGATPSLISDIINADNFQGLTAKLKKFEKEAEELQQKVREEENAAIQNAEAIKAENDEANRLYEIDKQSKELNFKREELYAKLSSEMGTMDSDTASNNYNTILREIREKERSNKANEKLKNKEIDVKEKIELKKISKMSVNRKT